MKAIRIVRFGGPQALQMHDVSTPRPEAGDVLIRTMAAGLDPIDYWIREGRHPPVQAHQLPLTLGREVAGIVTCVGTGVSRFKVGDRVFGMTDTEGGFAEYTRVPALYLAKVPESIDWTHAAALPQAAHTAWQALMEHGQLKPGQNVLIHGAAGGVGHLAVQFAKLKGARVHAVASGAAQSFLRSLGVHRAIDYQSERFENLCQDIDLVIDLIGGDTQARSRQVLRSGGRLVSTAPAGGDAQGAIRFTPRPDGAELTEIASLIERGLIGVQVQKVFALEQAALALDYLTTRHIAGKIVLRIAA
jgi:NADPH:quinone reductase-like Zn-dependent oxidoreductase